MSLERPVAPDPYDYLPPVAAFDVTSADLVEGEPMPMAHVNSSAGGGNISPELTWTGFPAGTRSFAVTCFDPDAPTGCGFWHWLALDIPTSVTSLASGAGSSDATLPPGAFHVRNDFLEPAYSGAAPPKGDQVHRYMFVVHALDVDRLDLDPSAHPGMVSFTLTFHTLARARIVATCQL